MNKLGIAVIGCGNAGYNHLKNFLSEPEVAQVVAVDLDKQRLEEIAKQYNIRTTSNYRIVIEDKSINAVVIATANETHPKIAIEAMKNGKDVFCEKPIATKLDLCRKAVEVARKENRIFHTHFELRHSVIPARIKEIIEDGEIGSLRSLNLIHYRGPFRPPWKGKQILSGGLSLMETCHAIDLFRHLAKCDIKKVFAFSPFPIIPYYNYADTEYLTMKMERGIISHITTCHTRSADYGIGGNQYTKKKYGHQYEYNILGTKGSIWYDALRGEGLYVYGFKGKGENWHCVLKRTEDYTKFTFNEQIHGSDHREFIKAVIEKRDTYIPPEDALKTHEVCFAIEKSRKMCGKGIVPDEL